MNTKTLRALRSSIAHHKRLLAGKRGEKLGPKYCALCKGFIGKPMTDHCEGCPVKEKTGVPFCEHTPYDSLVWAEFALEQSISESAQTQKAALEQFQKCEQAEIAFLESLLPKGAKK